MRTTLHRLQVAAPLARFIDDEVLPGTGLDRDGLLGRLRRHSCTTWRRRTPRCWPSATACRPNSTPGTRPTRARSRRWPAYRAFLEKIGYLVPVPAKVKATTKNVDAELALQAGPQLVVPITNARYALNAANARWGSLYDALYGTDVLPETDGAKKARQGLQPGARREGHPLRAPRARPLRAAEEGLARRRTGYAVEGGQLVVTLKDGSRTAWPPARFVGHQGDAAAPASVLLRHHGLHLEIRIDRNTAIGTSDAAGVSDLVLEAALSTILDLEDSVAVVDPDMGLTIEDGVLTVTRPTEQKRHKALHGLYRSLLSNLIVGVSDGYKKELELVGVGYKATNNGNIIDMSLGYSHNIYLVVPAEIKVETKMEKGKNPIITLQGTDKQLIGLVAAKIKSLRKSEPYKGKGIKFVGEVIRRKAGKTAGKK